MKFIHMADVHLGAEPESGTSLGPIRKREIWDAFRDVIEVCEKEQVDLLLIPGDLFHGQPLLRDVKEVDFLFRKLTHTKVVMIAGNHDCLMPDSHYYDIPFPDHVTFLMDHWADSVYFPELNTEIFGLSYEVKQIAEPRYDAIQVQNPDRINILIAHGNINGGDKSIPIHRAAIETAGFDYAALGHIHTRIDISHRIAYSGGFEPLERKETGKKGYIRGEITKQKGMESMLYWEFVPHAKREYIPLEVEVTTETTELSLCEKICLEIRNRGMQHMYMVTLVGTRSREMVWKESVLLEAVQNRGGLVVEFQDASVPDFPIERLKEEQKGNLIGQFIEAMEQQEDRELASQALQYGLQAMLARDERK